MVEKMGDVNLKERNKNRNSGGGARSRTKGDSFHYTETAILIQHGALLGTVDRMWPHFEAAFFHTYSTLSHSDYEKALDTIAECIGDIISDSRELVADENHAITAMLKLQKTYKGEMVPSTDMQKEFKVRVRSFVYRQYLDLISEVNDYMNKIVLAEQLGCMPWSERTRRLKEAPKFVVEVTKRFQRISSRINLKAIQQSDSIIEHVRLIVSQSDAPRAENKSVAEPNKAEAI